MNDRVSTLLDFFVEDVLEPGQAAAINTQRCPGGSSDRELLSALLTVRRPGPLPATIFDDLESLLADEREQRGHVEAASLPSLADEGTVISGFPAARVGFWRGDLTMLQADAIVNAANNEMLGCFSPAHACIDNAIHKTAGPRLREECDAHMRAQGALEPAGSAVVTGGYQLPANYVIHTVGPIVHGEADDVDCALLASSYRAVLDAAEAHPDIITIGMCSVSTGVFGFPKRPAAALCMETLSDWFSAHPGSNLKVIISLFADVDEAAYRAALLELAAR